MLYNEPDPSLLIAEKYNIEIGAEIFKGDGGCFLGNPITDFHSHTVPNIHWSSQAKTRNGIEIHTHQTDNFYSGQFGDLERSNGYRTISYLSNKEGLFQYNGRQFISGWKTSGVKPRIENYFRKYHPNIGDGEWHTYRP